MDPHKRSATIEVINDREKAIAQGRFATDRDGHQTMLKLGRQHNDRVRAVEGSNGIGKHLAQRLVADGETVLDVPAKLSARARVFDTGQGRKTGSICPLPRPVKCSPRSARATWSARLGAGSPPS
jgi:transposase